MISLSHLKKCASIIKPEAFEGEFEFCTDTRKYKHPSAFVAIPGAKVNPLDVIDPLLGQGCPMVIFQEDLENIQKVKTLKSKFPDTKFVAVTDSVTFLQELANQHILAWQAKRPGNTVFAISGSNGKTTHKEMLSFILKTINPGRIVATEKNNNNHLGVPLTLLQVSEETEMVVLELGSNHPGEIKVLCDIAVPNAGLTTNIGATHLEFFGTEEKVFEEEGYLYQAIKEATKGQGFYLINKDDRFLKNFPLFPGSISYGESTEAQAQITFQEHGAEINWGDRSLRVVNEHITGRHNKLNLITCAFVALHFYPQKEKDIIAAAAGFRPTKNRSEWIDFENRPIYLDAYNANPSSMRAALEGFKESVMEKGIPMEQACIVLGDMNELGDSAPLYHREIGAFLQGLGFKQVYFVGRYATFYVQGCAYGHARTSTAEFKNEFRNQVLKKYSIHFIKGSRSLQLESLFDIN